MNEELYFCMYLTADEHDIVAWEFKSTCDSLGCVLQYYRQLKDGHVPMYREVKVVGTLEQINRFKKYLHTNKYDTNIERNPHKLA